MRFPALTAVAAVLIFAGCGSDDPSATGNSAGDGEPSAGQTKGVADGPMTPRRYEQLEDLYEAGIESEKAGAVGEFRASTRILLRACDRVDRDDRLLAAVTLDCDQALSELHAIFGEDCSSPESCAPLARRGARAARQSIETGRETNDVIADEVDDVACRDALMSSDRYLTALSKLADALDDLAATIDENGDIDAAQARLDRASAAIEALPSARAMLRRFQRACAPSA